MVKDWSYLQGLVAEQSQVIQGNMKIYHLIINNKKKSLITRTKKKSDNAGPTSVLVQSHFQSSINFLSRITMTCL